MIGGKSGGGGGGGPQNSTQVSQPHDFAFNAVRDYVNAAQELAGREYNPYPGQRLADLTPTHQAALDYGRGAMTGALPMAQGIMSQFATGQHNQPAFVHPFLSGGVGAMAPNNYFFPFPWGYTGNGGAGGDPTAGSGSPAPAPTPSTTIPAGHRPLVNTAPPSLSALAGSGTGNAAGAAAAAAGAGSGAVTRNHGGGGRQVGFYDPNPAPAGSTSSRTASRRSVGTGRRPSTTRWHQFLDIPYGTTMPEGIYNVAGLGAIHADPSRPPDWETLRRYYDAQDRWSEGGAGGDQ